MKRLIFAPIAFLLLATACTKNITGDNVNPKAPVVVPSFTVFTAGEKNLVDLYTSDSWNSSPFRVLAQTWTQNTYNNETHYKFDVNNAPGGWWTAIYVNALGNLQQAKTLYPNDVKDAAVLKNDLLITDILEVYSFQLLVNTYGNIPYQQSLNRTNAFPAYTDAKEITYDLIARLDTAIRDLNTGAASLGTADQIYKGDVSKWKKFAATLKLKLALLIADKDATTGASKAAEAIAAGLLTSNDDNALLPYDASSATTSNPIWQDLVNSGGHYYSPAAFFINTLVSYHDPRLPLLFTKDPNGQYSGGIAGAGNSYLTLSTFSAQWLGPTYAGDLLDFSETEFLLAEAAERRIAVTGTAALHYDSAVTASVVFWGGVAADAQTYLAQPSVAYATASGSWRQKIGYQKWIAFANRNWDSWTEIRRLGYPNIDVVSPPIGANGNLPLRFYYPPAEQTSNAKNWADAVKALPGGQDVVSAKLFWQL